MSKSKRILVVAPHPDDELLGCGGTLLRHTAEGDILGWLLLTGVTEEDGWSSLRVAQRKQEIETVRKGLGINPNHFYSLGYSAAKLDQVPLNQLIEKLSKVFKDFQPEIILLPYPGDIHSDHRIAFEAACACTKWFRYPSVKKVMAYETLSETDFGIDPRGRNFNPNIFFDIGNYLEKKLELLSVYTTELAEYPFPRSERAVRALSEIRGVQSGLYAAEAFMMLKGVE